MRRCLMIPATQSPRRMTMSKATPTAPPKVVPVPSVEDRARAIQREIPGLEWGDAMILARAGLTASAALAMIGGDVADIDEVIDIVEWRSGPRLRRVFRGDFESYRALRRATRRQREAENTRVARLARLKGVSR
ncbi:MAG: hypothetical protein SF069_10555 [Phycisphaerae bacterium]|nr:hypothetical protein [Phycisphaerae bacterium]